MSLTSDKTTWLWDEDADTATTRSAYSSEGDVYDRQARAGNTVLSVMLEDDSLIQQAVTILDAHHPLEIDEHTHETEPTSSTSGSFVQPEAAGKTSLSPSGVDYSTSAVATPATGMAPTSAIQRQDTQESASLSAGMPGSGRVAPVATSATGDEAIPLAEEQLEIGMRTVEQNVTLHGERVTIERRHPVGAAAASDRQMQIETTKVDGLTIRYGRTQANGSAIPLLLFNGIGASIELLAPFADAMREAGFSSIAFDVPGVGGSVTPLLPYRFSRIARGVEHLLRDIGVSGPVDVLGVSWGGALAQQFVHQYPARCRRLVLAATSAGAVMVPGRPSVLKKMINPRRYTDKDFMAKIGAELYGGRFREDPGLIREHARHMSPPSGRGYLWQMLAAAGWTSILWLRRVKQPTLVLMGRDDPIVPMVNGRILAGLIPNSRLVTIDDGHLFLLSRIHDIVPVIRDFLSANENAEVTG